MEQISRERNNVMVEATDSDNHAVQLSDGGQVSTELETLTPPEEGGINVPMDNIIIEDANHLQQGKSGRSLSSPIEPTLVEIECQHSNGCLPLAIVDCHTFNENEGNLLPLAEGREAMIILPTTNQPYLSSALHETFGTAVSSGIAIQCNNSLDKQNTPIETSIQLATPSVLYVDAFSNTAKFPTKQLETIK